MVTRFLIAGYNVDKKGSVRECFNAILVRKIALLENFLHILCKRGTTLSKRKVYSGIP
jgi:hypothetical protein